MNRLWVNSVCDNVLKRQGYRHKHNIFSGMIVLIATMNASAEDTGLADLSLEELAALPVISVSKSAKPVSEAAASIFVITERDIHNAGSSTLPEALRLAPNLQVARIDARNYAISARGFNNSVANKLLVLIDGRTIYSPLFSGVFWDAQDVMLEDLNRIEVVSGAGGTLWGANAVNGVVNIVTRSAAETQGTLVSLGGSSEEQQAAVRYGGSLDNGGFYRVYAKQNQHDDTLDSNHQSTQSGWQRTQTGFRADWGSGAETFTLQGDAYTGKLNQLATDDTDIAGANLLMRKGWQLESGSKLSFQAYIDHTQRNQPGNFKQNMNTYDMELQHEWALTSNQNIVWGAGYRYTTDDIVNGPTIAILPTKQHMRWSNFFVQDEIALADDVQLTLGSKWEDNPYTGLEVMPGAQIAWAADPTKLVWASLSRAVRSPARIDHDLYSPGVPTIVNGTPIYIIAGGPDFVSEVADIFEIGYRSQPVARVSWSITAFYSQYDKLRTLGPNPDGFGFTFQNMSTSNTTGVEMWGSWQVIPRLRLHGGLVVQDIDTKIKNGSMDLSNTNGLFNDDPRSYAMLRSTLTISSNIQLDATLRHVSELTETNLPAYTVMDVRLAWEPSANVELSLQGQNLLDSHHTEFNNQPERSEYEPRLYAKLVWSL